MFRVSYIDNNINQLAHKGGLHSTKEAMEWVRNQGEKITALKLLVWDEYIQCYSTLKSFIKSV